MSDYLRLDIPEFHPQYQADVDYGYNDEKKKDNVKKVLYKATRGYCMYCYSRVLTDGKEYGQLEHAIEKNNSTKLIECVPNLGLSCSICNQSLKKVGEKGRRLDWKKVEAFERESNCPVNCVIRCEAYDYLLQEYMAQDEAQIILQPMGATGKESGHRLRIQYDMLDAEFKPYESDTFTYPKSEYNFIEKHIKRFNLNDSVYKTRKLFEFLEEVIDNNGRFPKMEKNNLIVELFVEVLEGKSKDEILNICKLIFISEILKFN